MNILFLFLATAVLAQARTFIGTVNHLDIKEGAPTLLFLSDGSVMKTSSSLLPFLNLTKTMKLTADEDGFLKTAESIEESMSEEWLERKSYTPSRLSSTEEARLFYSGFRQGARSASQCFNRAHIWAFEAKEKSGLNSMKAFLFFTSKYIREYNFMWWFHVAPFTYIDGRNSTTEAVLDPFFLQGPVSMREWTNHFMKNKAECSEIEKYSDYEAGQSNAWCFLQKTSMYYLQPLDLERLERGLEKTNWNSYELKRAYRNGFGIIKQLIH